MATDFLSALSTSSILILGHDCLLNTFLTICNSATFDKYTVNHSLRWPGREKKNLKDIFKCEKNWFEVRDCSKQAGIDS